MALLLIASDSGTVVARAQEAQAPAPAAPTYERIVLSAGRSTVLTTDFDITRVAVTNPEVADAIVVKPRELLIDGKGAGTVSLIIWGTTERVQYDVVVDPGVPELQQRLQALFPGEAIEAMVGEDAVILAGRASSNTVSLRAGEIAKATVPEATIINMLELPGGMESQQVMLQVRVAEVNRRALQEVGVSLFTGATGAGDYIGRTSTSQFAAPVFEDLQRTSVDGEVTNLSGDITFSDFLNLFIFNTRHNVGALVRALESKGYFQSLAEPNLIAYNGQEASFLAGGELPIPMIQGASGAVTVQYREFGVRLTFTPTIAGDVIRLRIRPEVSSLDFANGVSLQGFLIPAISVRRAETNLELRDGQSFAIAGLLDNELQEQHQAVPLLSKLPIIGYLFRSKSERVERTELMVLITPRLVRALNPDEVPPLPVLPGRFLPPEEDLGGGFQGGGGPMDAPQMGADQADSRR
jgi:pilus assembly protein CpaC